MFDRYGLFNRLPNDGGIVEAPFKSNRAERRKTMCYPNPKAEVVTEIAPFFYWLL
ncbi:MAG: hypothetical protein WAV38_27170 [Xanthobacteraceae bacterium]